MTNQYWKRQTLKELIDERDRIFDKETHSPCYPQDKTIHFFLNEIKTNNTTHFYALKDGKDNYEDKDCENMYEIYDVLEFILFIDWEKHTLYPNISTKFPFIKYFSLPMRAWRSDLNGLSYKNLPDVVNMIIGDEFYEKSMEISTIIYKEVKMKTFLKKVGVNRNIIQKYFNELSKIMNKYSLINYILIADIAQLVGNIYISLLSKEENDCIGDLKEKLGMKKTAKKEKLDWALENDILERNQRMLRIADNSLLNEFGFHFRL